MWAPRKLEKRRWALSSLSLRALSGKLISHRTIGSFPKINPLFCFVSAWPLLAGRSCQFHANTSHGHFRKYQHGCARGVVREPYEEIGVRNLFAVLEQAQ